MLNGHVINSTHARSPPPQSPALLQIQHSNFHCYGSLFIRPGPPKEPKNWPKYNEIVYAPRKEGEPVRPAEVVHSWANVKYSPKKLWYISLLIRGMSIDEAIKQLSFYARQGGVIVKEILEEAQELAVKEHNVEFRSNLWVSDVIICKARTVKGARKHARGRYSMLSYRYTHILVRLREGQPPKHYYAPEWGKGNELMAKYIQQLRDRQIRGTL